MKRFLQQLLVGELPPTAKQVIAVTKTYTRADLAPALGETSQSPIRIELPIRGRRNLSWFVTIGERKCMVRCYMPDEALEMETHITALRLMEGNGVSAPRLLHAIESPRQYGVFFATSEFVEGSGRGGQQHMSQDEVGCLAMEAARLHSIHSDKWGSLVAPSHENYFGELMRLVDRYVKRARDFKMLEIGQDEKLRSWFRDWQPKLNNIKRFSLVHGDLHPNNVLFRADGGCAIVDTDEFNWGLPMWDVALIHDRGCKGAAECRRNFDETYLPLLDQADQQTHRELMLFFEAFYRLRAVMRAVRLQDRKQDRITTPRALKGDLWQELLTLCGLQ